MGQYHDLICIETRSFVGSGEINGGSKAAEQISSSTGLPSALALLCASTKGQHERDLPWAAHGAWAGKTPMNFGDYANDGDIVGRALPVTESKIFSSTTNKKRSLSHGTSRATKFSDVSQAILPVLERVHHHRYYGMDVNGKEVIRGAMAAEIPVRKDLNNPDEWCLDLSDLTSEVRQDVLDYYERIGVTKTDTWRRAPLNIDLCGPRSSKLAPAPDEVPTAAYGTGEPLLWVNLDRAEFVDPASLGDVPDLAGVMEGMSARAVLAMLYHHTVRGGGDIGREGPLSISGRWRGDRIALIGKDGIKVSGLSKVTQDIARETFADISKNALLFINPEDTIGTDALDSKGGVLDAQKDIPADLTNPMFQALKVALKSQAVTGLREEHGNQILQDIRAIFVPSLVISKDASGKDLQNSQRLAHRFELLLDDGKITLDQATQIKIQSALKDVPSEHLALTKSTYRNCVDVSNDVVNSITLRGMSNHILVKIMPT